MIPLIRNKINQLKEVRDNLDTEVMRAVSFYENEIIKGVQDRLWRGENIDGTAIRPGYSSYTVSRKQRQGRPYYRVTLYDEGDFYDSAYLHKEKDRFWVEFADWKTETLIEKYGKDIVGLDEGQVAKLRGDISRRVKEKLK